MNTTWAYYLWLKSLKKENDFFINNLNNPNKIQEQKLFDYLNRFKNSNYGVKHSLSKIATVQEFQKEVPIVDYEDLSTYISCISRGDNNVLANEKVLFFEETSGTQSDSKLIPYNRSLLKEFNTALAPWMHAVFKLYENVFSGKSYWTISPPNKAIWRTEGGIAVGIDNDSRYLSWAGRVLSKHMIFSSRKNHFVEKTAFFIAELKEIINYQKIGFISSWSPSFLLMMDEILREHWTSIVSKTSNLSTDATWDKIFPNLKLISCWTHGSSQVFQNKLNTVIGDIPIQAKGLLSSEGVVSIPISKEKDPVLSFTSHFFEFECQLSKDVILCKDLVVGNKYEVILTTGNGFLRYRTKDIVLITGKIMQTPTMIFVGRKSLNSDIVGEKLTELHCVEILDELSKNFEIDIYTAYFSVGFIKKNKYFYKLVLVDPKTSFDKDKILKFVELKLRSNPYYEQAILMGQLEELKIEALSKNQYVQMLENYYEEKNIKAGDRKPPVLFPLKLKDVIIEL